jgi:hypothetical protein
MRSVPGEEMFHEKECTRNEEKGCVPGGGLEECGGN